MKKIFFLLLLFVLSGCDMQSFFPSEVNEKFGQQNFNSAISLIELHKTRNGVYPENLAELEFLGDWDAIYINAVKYEKTENGYNLHVLQGISEAPNLTYPAEFKRGLGLEDSNVAWE